MPVGDCEGCTVHLITKYLVDFFLVFLILVTLCLNLKSVITNCVYSLVWFVCGCVISPAQLSLEQKLRKQSVMDE